MKIFIDTANINDIKAAAELGVVCGVTTNPSLIAKEGRRLEDVITEIASIVDGPISAEVTGSEAPDMIAQAKKLSAINKNIVIKIPMTEEGLKATKALTALNIKTNVTLIFSPAQALLAAKAGATYVSPFIGRLNDISEDGCDCVAKIARIFKLHNISTEIIAASIRGPQDAVDAALAGAHIATIPYKVICQMAKHPLTDAGIAKFNADWKATFDK